MTVSYIIDSKQQVVFTQVVGVVDGSQLLKHQNRLKDVKLRSIVNSHLVKCSPWGSSARRAIVVPNPFVFGLLRIFQTLMSGAHGKIAIFYDMKSAKSWLDLYQQKNRG